MTSLFSGTEFDNQYAPRIDYGKGKYPPPPKEGKKTSHRNLTDLGSDWN